MRFWVRIGEIAFSAGSRYAVGEVRKGLNGIIAHLFFHFIIIDCRALDPRRGTRFEPSQRKAELGERGGKPVCTAETRGAFLLRHAADMNQAFEVDSRTQHQCFTGIFHAAGADYARYSAVFCDNIFTFILSNGQVFLLFKRSFHALMVSDLIYLRSWGVYGRPLSEIEHTHLDEGFIGCYAHFAAERVNLAHQMPLARSANRRIAGAERNGIEVQRDAQRPEAHTCAGKRGFNACMPCPSYDNIKFFCTILHSASNSAEFSIILPLSSFKTSISFGNSILTAARCSPDLFCLLSVLSPYLSSPTIGQPIWARLARI